MADRHLEPDTPELRVRWGSFAWTKENAAKAKEIVARYPAGRQRSAVMPLLDLAQRDIPMGTAYAVWTGIGAAGAFVVGLVLYGDPANLPRILGVGLIVAGVVTLKLTH